MSGSGRERVSIDRGVWIGARDDEIIRSSDGKQWSRTWNWRSGGTGGQADRRILKESASAETASRIPCNSNSMDHVHNDVDFINI